MRHLLTLDDMPIETIRKLITRAIDFKLETPMPCFDQVYAANLFFENSTRTKCSFEVAQRKLQMQVIPFDAQTSSIQKGETLYDTVKTMEAIGIDVVVIRDRADAYYADLIGSVNLSIINGGDGMGNHPTQALLDLMTIYEQFGQFEGIEAVIVGDVLHSRVAHSNIKVMQRLGMKVQVAKTALWAPYEDATVPTVALDEVISDVDIVMLLRIQHERHTQSYDTHDFLNMYGLTTKRSQQMKSTSIIMHPAPINRNVEIAEELIEAPNSRIFTQMTNGVFMRMAVLEYVLEGWKKDDK